MRARRKGTERKGTRTNLDEVGRSPIDLAESSSEVGHSVSSSCRSEAKEQKTARASGRVVAREGRYEKKLQGCELVFPILESWFYTHPQSLG